MPKKINKKVFLLGLLIVLFTNCKHVTVNSLNPGDSDSSIALLNLINDTLTQPGKGHFLESAGASDLWGSFESFFKICVKNSTFPNNDNIFKTLFSDYKLLYLGPTNSKYLGTVYSHDGVQTKTELTEWLTPDQLNRFVNKGIPVSNCDITKVDSFLLNIAVGNIPLLGDDSLGFAIKNYDSLINSVGSWTIDEIRTSDFVKFLNDSSSNKNIEYYNDIMTEKNNIVSFKIVKVSGFSTDMRLTKDLTLGLNIDYPLASTVSTITGKDSTIFKLTFSKKSNRIVNVKGTGDFYAFALVMKGSKVR